MFNNTSVVNNNKANSASKSAVKANDNYVPKYDLSLWERETTFNLNEQDKEASIYTHNKALIRKLDKYCEQFPELYQLEKQNLYGKHLSKTYTIPKKYISVKCPRILSEAQKISNINKIKKMHEAKRKKLQIVKSEV